MAAVCKQKTSPNWSISSPERKRQFLFRTLINFLLGLWAEIFSFLVYFYELQGQIMQAELGNSV